jgi:hypothetical protein
VLYLSRNALAAVAVDTDLVTMLDPDATSESSVTRLLREAKCLPSNPPITFSEENPWFDNSHEAILLALA